MYYNRFCDLSYLGAFAGAETSQGYGQPDRPTARLTAGPTAVGTWALFDYCTADAEVVFNGAGYYRDDYVKRDGRWLIHRTQLEAEPF